MATMSKDSTLPVKLPNPDQQLSYLIWLNIFLNSLQNYFTKFRVSHLVFCLSSDYVCTFSLAWLTGMFWKEGEKAKLGEFFAALKSLTVDYSQLTKNEKSVKI